VDKYSYELDDKKEYYHPYEKDYNKYVEGYNFQQRYYYPLKQFDPFFEHQHLL
jgi:hypothetical protein